MSNLTDRINEARHRATASEDYRERRYWKAHLAYLLPLDENRATYKALAEKSGLSMTEFTARVRAEIDEDVAGSDSGEWVRAARVVLDRINEEARASYGEEPDEEEFYHRVLWERACNARLGLCPSYPSE